METIRRGSIRSLATLVVLIATTALAAPTPEQICQKAKTVARGKWHQCRAIARGKTMEP